MTFVSARVVVSQLLLLICLTFGMVCIPERQEVKTLFISSKEQLYLETAPLIGGPSWLPLHVKVVLETNTEQHKWDLIPLQPKDPETLQSLLTLQAIPARVRYQNRTISASSQQSPPVGFLPNGGIVLQEDTAVETMDSIEPLLLLQAATMFCATFPADIHLLQNNCWSFAWELYDHLLAEQKRQQQQQGET